MSDPVALIIDDEQDLLSLLSITLRRMGVESIKAGNVAEAKAKLDSRQFDLCLTDLRLPDGTGMEIVKYVQDHHDNTPIAVITAFGDPKTAVEALKLGAFDYIAKPIEVEQLQAIIESSIRLGESKEAEATVDIESATGGLTLLGESEAMDKIRALIAKVARNQAPVHIYGETGTGKALIARMIHDKGPRNKKHFVAVNCGAIPRELMESEFFGHKKGSFTGAVSDKQGLFEAANGGTLFLDEIAELPQDLQVKLLRTIQEKKVRAVGDVLEKQIDVRLISATHKNLQAMIEQGEFREDLYYRINVIPVNAPSLRQRPMDIPILATHFIKVISDKIGIPKPKITAEALSHLATHKFPGNVRELENLLERILALHEGDTITIEDVDLPQHQGKKNQTDQTSVSEMDGPIEEHLGRIEKKLIQDALERSGGNITRAAELLGTTFRSLRYKIKKLEI
ncbi:MAG: sigma-54-dependent Fis family transcriptional regulator [Gammaproteobacteria bacterium]|nr:sigma-54-dependent Fis family transcriptional regulator [Gammaproteobacteria bacterium]